MSRKHVVSITSQWQVLNSKQGYGRPMSDGPGEFVIDFHVGSQRYAVPCYAMPFHAMP